MSDEGAADRSTAPIRSADAALEMAWRNLDDDLEPSWTAWRQQRRERVQRRFGAPENQALRRAESLRQRGGALEAAGRLGEALSLYRQAELWERRAAESRRRES